MLAGPLGALPKKPRSSSRARDAATETAEFIIDECSACRAALNNLRNQGTRIKRARNKNVIKSCPTVCVTGGADGQDYSIIMTQNATGSRPPCEAIAPSGGRDVRRDLWSWRFRCKVPYLIFYPFYINIKAMPIVYVSCHIESH